MTEWVLTRWGFRPQAAFGMMEGPGFRSISLECPWLHNEPFVSCVPEGSYELVPHAWRGEYPTVALRGGDVGHMPSEGRKRSLICVHPANFPRQLKGCIALGRTISVSTSGLWVLSSRSACDEWLQRIAPGDRLRIINFGGEVEVPSG